MAKLGTLLERDVLMVPDNFREVPLFCFSPVHGEMLYYALERRILAPHPKTFPDANTADENGLLCMGADLGIETLLLAYRSGIFPWPYDERIITWFSPPKRALIFLDSIHLSRSLKKLIKNNPFQIRFNSNFDQVIRSCAELKNRK